MGQVPKIRALLYINALLLGPSSNLCLLICQHKVKNLRILIGLREGKVNLVIIVLEFHLENKTVVIELLS